MDMYAFVILFVYSGLLIVCHCMDTYNNSISLYKYLFKNNRHNPSIVPKCTNNDHVTVYINTAIRELVELNEKFQLVRVKLWVRLQWRDCSLTWSPGDFGGEEGIIVPYGTLWMPDLAMYEGCSDEANMPDMKEYRASIMYNGFSEISFPYNSNASMPY
ncbi:hypothetical protein FSP39_003615 [Pinctada imbricata]|uniref:Neurotransmitter-gated ion-channel ligand-binding domain-containing protein n=1 Tax=Pinctada imbricata TaxID=66713 RepID=A0AA89BMU5_PINIB|nr:hypothetical protein FSP39_003615 [Pinctada imbricata]